MKKSPESPPVSEGCMALRNGMSGRSTAHRKEAEPSRPAPLPRSFDHAGYSLPYSKKEMTKA